MFKLDIQKTEQSRIGEVDFNNIVFGRIFSDHMFVCDYDGTNWVNPQIVPYGKIPMYPSLSALHYGQSIFEGMKAQKDPHGNVLIFRPIENAQRLNRSAQRMSMPDFPEDLFLMGLEELLKIDYRWVPNDSKSGLYIRPFMFATDDFLGVRTSLTYKFIIYTTPVTDYYSEPIKVRVETEFVRAAKGGIGEAKAAGNYAASLYPASKAQKAGYHQCLWTDATEHKYIEELGTSNFFMVVNNALITPELSGTILDGITRKSVLELAKHLGIKCEERRISTDELEKVLKDGTLSEAFATGTAATLAQIKLVSVNGKDYELNISPNNMAVKLKSELEKIKTGTSPDIFQWNKSIPSPLNSGS